MPKRNDIKRILIIGSGPIVIGQACEFDYSATQALRVLKKEKYYTILVNSNPATIMTDPEFSDATYIEPLEVEFLEKIIKIERPDAILPTFGGQTALNLTVKLHNEKILEKYSVEILGANINAIKLAEDRQAFKNAMIEAEIPLPASRIARNILEAKNAAKEIGFPLIIRPSFNLGGGGSKVVNNMKEFLSAAERALSLSLNSKILIEEYLKGWKEFELEVMRDSKDNCVCICSIENIDPMGVHTGDSITVAPAQTLTDKEYQLMREYAFRCIRKIGVETGGSNVQFAVNPANGRMVIIEINPRVSRSSALASKATGFPIAKIAALLAVGYSLDEIPNDITKKTPACFEPAIDYVVVKIPRFAFEKFSPVIKNKKFILNKYEILGSQMKSVGEAMAIGRTFKEALEKGIRAIEIGRYGLGADGLGQVKIVEECKKNEKKKRKYLKIVEFKLKNPNCDRIFNIKYALELGMPIEKIQKLSGIDKWFINQINEIIEMEEKIKKSKLTSSLLIQAKKYGFSDYQIGYLKNKSENAIYKLRLKNKILPCYKVIDTCAAEFKAYTPYFYSSYDGTPDYSNPLHNETILKKPMKDRVIIIGSGPNRIGQGIEFDYSLTHAAMEIRKLGFEVVMINSNPETVSTDYDVSDVLYFEPLSAEEIYNVYRNEEFICKKYGKKLKGVITQFGGQTALNIAVKLKNKIKILGSSIKSIIQTEDRKLFAIKMEELKIPYPDFAYTSSKDEAIKLAGKIGYPVIIRPSYVIGGRSMEIIYDRNSLINYLGQVDAREFTIDRFIDGVELEVDVVADGKNFIICGVMEHIEKAGIHSGDSACRFPVKNNLEAIKKCVKAIVEEFKVVGLMNIQFVFKDRLYVIEVNLRASRTLPFLSKSTSYNFAAIATDVIMGENLVEVAKRYRIEENRIFNPKYTTVKEAIMPFSRFEDVDIVLKPEMRSTGEVMGIDASFYNAYLKAQIAANGVIEKKTCLFSIRDTDKPIALELARKLQKAGYRIYATPGTCRYFKKSGLNVMCVKMEEIEDILKTRKIGFIVNIPKDGDSYTAGFILRRMAINTLTPIITTIEAGSAFIEGILKGKKFIIKSLKEWYNLYG